MLGDGHEGAAQRRLARVTAHGLAWIYGATAVQIVASLGAQLALGWLLSDRDFGLYAIAIGATVLLQSVRDGGVAKWLVQESRNNFVRWVHSGFWLTVLSSLLVAALIAGAAPFLATLYGEPGLTGLLLVIAAAIPVGAYGVVAMADLQSSLSFVTLSKINGTRTIIRYGLTVLLAVLGFGPYSFVLPLLVVSGFESVAGYWATRYRPQRRPLREAIGLVGRTRWVLVGTLLSTLTLRGDYLALGLVASTAAIGVYYFAYSLTWQVVFFVQDGLRKVMLPALARARGAGNLAYFSLVGVRLTALLAAALSLFVAVVADDLEAILWRGRWESAVPVMRVLAVAFPVEAVALLGEIVLMAAGRFRGWSAAVLVRGVGIVAFALVAGSLFPEDPTAIAAGVAVHLVVVNGLVGWRSLASIGVGGGSYVSAVAIAYGLTAAASATALGVAGALWAPRTLAHLVTAAVTYVAVVALLGVGLLGRRIRTMWQRLQGDDPDAPAPGARAMGTTERTATPGG